jgi:signal transduction histidine kinase
MASPTGPTTWFLSPERADPALLAQQIELAACNPVIDAVLRSWPGAVAVLNGHRQLVALNDTYLKAIGVQDAASALGLRPGEAIGCDRAWDQPGGCGTGRSCPGCGAAISIVSALRQGRPKEMDCVLTLTRGDGPVEVAFRVQASPLDLHGERMVVLCLADVSAERRHAALERAFLHDMANLASGLSGTVAWALQAPASELPEALCDLDAVSGRLSREIEIQRALDAAQAGVPRLRAESVQVELLAGQLKAVFLHHPVAAGRRLLLDLPAGGLAVETDPVLLHRVLANMLCNAFEASAAGDAVRFAAEAVDGQVLFSVWNAGTIPEQASRRIFQRYFSTKAGAGRGQGTFVMKLFGERVLGGQVAFTSLPGRGTTFTLSLPRVRPAAGSPAGDGADG